jgi:hypothetical protein
MKKYEFKITSSFDEKERIWRKRYTIKKDGSKTLLKDITVEIEKEFKPYTVLIDFKSDIEACNWFDKTYKGY